MNETLHNTFSNPIFAVPVVVVLDVLFLLWQKRQFKHKGKSHHIDKSFIIRNSLFVGLLAFVVIYFGQNSFDSQEYMRVGPAPF